MSDAPGRVRRGRPVVVVRLAALSVVALAALLVLRFLVADDGYPALLSLRAELASLQADAQRLEQQNRRLRERIQDLSATLHPVERIAREELDFAAPGEVIYLFPADLDERRRPRDPVVPAPEALP